MLACALAAIAGHGPGAGRARAQDLHRADPANTLARKYPGDLGIEKDPAVVWYEGFEDPTVAHLVRRYDGFKNLAGMALVPGVPTGSPGRTALRMRAGGATDATDLHKRLPTDEEEIYVRWYVKYQAGGKWHHSGMWFGGYNPPLRFPDPQAGVRPTGRDRFNIAVEPMGGGLPSPRMDFYGYWMKMRSHKDHPVGTAAYWGNTVVHQERFRVDDDAWMCIEAHVKLNPDPTSRAGARLAIWKNDQEVIRYTDTAPVGFWAKDRFCPDGADTAFCRKHRAGNPKREPLDLQWRSSSALKINALWPQNYVTHGPPTDVTFDDVVMARVRVGCLTVRAPASPPGGVVR